MSIEARIRSLVEAGTDDWFINVNMGEMEDNVLYSSTVVVLWSAGALAAERNVQSKILHPQPQPHDMIWSNETFTEPSKLVILQYFEEVNSPEKGWIATWSENICDLLWRCPYYHQGVNPLK